MIGRLPALERAAVGRPLGRCEVFISDDETHSVMVLEFVFRSEDITVWHGTRTLAVMNRLDFVAWLWEGGEFVVDDLAWNVEGRTTFLTIDGYRTYAVDGSTITQLAGSA